MGAAVDPGRTSPASRRALGKVLHSAPAHPAWSHDPILRDTLEQLHALMGLGPTMIDASPTRVLFLTSSAAKARLSPHLPDRTRGEVLAAPACAIVGYDVDFAEQLVEFLPRAPAVRSCFDDPEVVRLTATRNGALQGAYLIVAARSLGLGSRGLSGVLMRTGVPFEFLPCAARPSRPSFAVLGIAPAPRSPLAPSALPGSCPIAWSLASMSRRLFRPCLAAARGAHTLYSSITNSKRDSFSARCQSASLGEDLRAARC